MVEPGLELGTLVSDTSLNNHGILYLSVLDTVPYYKESLSKSPGNPFLLACIIYKNHLSTLNFSISVADWV